MERNKNPWYTQLSEGNQGEEKLGPVTCRQVNYVGGPRPNPEKGMSISHKNIK